MRVRFKKLHPEAVTPSYAKLGDAALDLTAISYSRTPYYWEFKTGLAFEIPEGYIGLLFPRSSISNTGHSLCNSVGVVDSGYRGEVTFRFRVDAFKNTYLEGDRVGQLIILPYPKIELDEVSELSDTERGKGGYGSTNNKGEM